MDGRITPAGSGDCCFRVIDNDLGRNTAKERQRSTVTAKPGENLLVTNPLGILVTASGQGHDEKPGFELFTGEDINDERAGPEVYLGTVTGSWSSITVASGGVSFWSFCRNRRTAE